MARYDVFVSFSYEDIDLVRKLSGALDVHGKRALYDEMFVGPGGVLIHKVEQTILDSANGLCVYSQAALASPWVREEYAALMERSLTARLFIPVLADGASEQDLPVPAQRRYYVDLRDPAKFDKEVAKLARAL